ncbi:TPR end-of-group domain-containing protein [Gilvimarinus xylanilyticus]|uniref:Tetratricopeptide repeat protein n=1 Tax=Gilvimarinus xylanilyticus TaxID=2944139 RepID=A0A9X2KST8_9GAMM|nr:tetratricopeptide repeat protein [Gilvimarinus xylanilyticus]MCP8898589.1 tetratricopeptide repeat protein [Gilvimarinus xylanilyticus]
MRCLIAAMFAIALALPSAFLWAQENRDNATAESAQVTEQEAQARVESLDEPLYNPFVERYVLDELKQLRAEMAQQRVELTEKIVDRQIQSVDRGVDYATSTISNFFYLIAAASSILVLVGWSSLRDIKERMNKIADEEVSKLVATYERRLAAIESQLTQKTRHIDENREEIERTQELHALWLRAAQESTPANKIAIYDQILDLHPLDCEALTYKADEVLELGEVQWAINLCHQALAIDADNAHAFYQLACAKTMLGNYDQAIHYLGETLERSQNYRETMMDDTALEPLHELPEFKTLLTPVPSDT